MTSRQALLASTVDYAGTFPPAKLSLGDSLQCGGTFRERGRNPWLLFRHAVAIDDLLSLGWERLIEADPSGSFWRFTAIGRATDPRGISDELRRLTAWNRRGMGSPAGFAAVSYETKALMQSESPGEILGALMPAFRAAGISPYFELSTEGKWRERWDVLGAALREFPDIASGLKLRTGGAILPSPEEIEACMRLCARHGLRFKATQGLHHAVSRGAEYGFVNLFFALNLLFVSGDDLKSRLFETCLTASDASEFAFSNDAVAWREETLSIAAISKARETHGGCFGSCSIDEPDEDFSRLYS